MQRFVKIVAIFNRLGKQNYRQLWLQIFSYLVFDIVDIIFCKSYFFCFVLKTCNSNVQNIISFFIDIGNFTMMMMIIIKIICVCFQNGTVILPNFDFADGVELEMNFKNEL
eukprot:TRINITY_DN7596_c1_g1_i1.p7 TRINITY_DN7596_c1_g1~~TRINITY_DN7596_c1_g1_i1.p7  ORF type:complete len:111 (+),score=2.59 TRINITY_DN7596_c1_g1_i1:781-1113(+)